MYFLYRVFDIFDKRIMRDNKVNLLKNGVKYILSFFKSAIYFEINQKYKKIENLFLVVIF